MVISFSQLLQDVLDAHRGHRVDRDRELVEQQKIRLLGQGPGNRQTLLLPPESRLPSELRRSFTSSHRAARVRHRSTITSRSGATS